MTPPEDPDAEARAKLVAETARIPWRELQRFFAQGRVIDVHPDLDLVEMALSIARDEARVIAPEMQQGRIALVSDERARAWLAADAEVWAVVVKPWVLIQEPRTCTSGSTPTPVHA